METGARIVCCTHEGRSDLVKMFRNQTRNKKGQSLVEYAMVAAIVAASIVAMSTYVFRSVQATQQMIHEEFRNE